MNVNRGLKMSASVLLLLSLLPCLPGLPAQARLSPFTSVPQNQTVSAGSDVVMSCSAGTESVCHWVKDGWMVEVGGRFSLKGCDLMISPVLESDEGEYQCQVGGRQPSVSPPASLKVDTAPGHPHILQGDSLKLDRGDTLQLTCQSEGGRPAADLEWWDSLTGRRIVSEVTQHVERSGHGFKTTSVLSLPANKHMQIYCTAFSEAFPDVKQTSPVEVQIRGEPRLETVQLREGEDVKIFCHNNIQDSNAQFKWFINDKLIPDETTDLLEINQFSKSYDKSVVKCATGHDEIVRAVQLEFNPEKKAESKIVTLDELMKRKGRQNDIMLGDEQSSNDDEIGKSSKAKTTFVCVVEDDEEVSREPKYVWVNGKLVTNTKATDKDNKSYKCKVVKNGSKKFEKMSKDLKSISKTLRKISKNLNEFSK